MRSHLEEVESEAVVLTPLLSLLLHCIHASYTIRLLSANLDTIANILYITTI